MEGGHGWKANYQLIASPVVFPSLSLQRELLVYFSVHLRTSFLISSSGTHPDLCKPFTAIPILLPVIWVGRYSSGQVVKTGNHWRLQKRFSYSKIMSQGRQNHFSCWMLWLDMVASTCPVIWQLCVGLTRAHQMWRNRRGKECRPCQCRKDAEPNNSGTALSCPFSCPDYFNLLYWL